MEEDIRLIENAIFDIETNNSDWKYCEDEDYCWLSENKVKAIKNIINRLKQDEKVIKEMAIAIDDFDVDFLIGLGNEYRVEEYFRKRVDNIE